MQGRGDKGESRESVPVCAETTQKQRTNIRQFATVRPQKRANADWGRFPTQPKPVRESRLSIWLLAAKLKECRLTRQNCSVKDRDETQRRSITQSEPKRGTCETQEPALGGWVPPQ